MIVLATERLRVSHFSPDDAEFIQELLNEPSFLQNIGDRGVRSAEDARRYIIDGPMASYTQHGFGLFRVALRESDEPIGMCGLLKRDTLPDVDIGYAYLPRYWSKGYAYEAAAAVMTYGKEMLGISRIIAITTPDNESSMRLLRKIGLEFERMISFDEGRTESTLFTPR